MTVERLSQANETIAELEEKCATLEATTRALDDATLQVQLLQARCAKLQAKVDWYAAKSEPQGSRSK